MSQSEVGLWKVVPNICCAPGFALSLHTTPQRDGLHTCWLLVCLGREDQGSHALAVLGIPQSYTLQSNFHLRRALFEEVSSVQQGVLVCSRQFSACIHLCEEPKSRVNNTQWRRDSQLLLPKNLTAGVGFEGFTGVHKMAVYTGSCELVQ